jgi:hypothetical protein
MRIIGYLIHWAQEETKNNSSSADPGAKKILKLGTKSDKIGVQALADQMLGMSALTKEEVNESAEELYKTTNQFKKRGTKRKGAGKSKGRNTLVQVSDAESVNSIMGGGTSDGGEVTGEKKEEGKSKKQKVVN